jgi:putative peptidoglycan lipid II flippase
VRIGVQALGVSMGLNLVVVLPLAILHDQPGLHALLALNNGLGAWFNSVMLYRGLRRQGVLHHSAGWRRLVVQLVVANAVMVAFLLYLAGDTSRWIEMGAWSRVQWMTLLVVGGAGLYFGTLWLLGMRVSHLRVAPTPLPSQRRTDETP